MALCSITTATAQITIGIGSPGVSIGIDLPAYPELVQVPGYPVYYAPRISSNYFFYDGLYWVYQGDNWYASSWYNGPWALVAPEAVPLFIWRVPVRYYRQPPAYFRGWRSDAPPRWGEHWGNSWEQSHRGWDNWNRNSVPAPAPLPAYQRQYSGTRYPHVEQQQVLHSQNYRYQPRDVVVQQHYQTQRMQSAPAASPPQGFRGTSRPSSQPQGSAPASRGQPPQTGGMNVQTPAVQAPPQQIGPAAQRQPQQPQQAAQREQREPRPQQAQAQRPAPVQATPQQVAPAAQRQPQQPPQAAQREQPEPRPQGQEKGPQGKSAHETRQGQDKGEQQGGERNK